MGPTGGAGGTRRLATRPVGRWVRYMSPPSLDPWARQSRPGDRLDTIVARKMRATLEPIHAMVYFAPEALDAWGRLFPYRSMGYFASRSAPMGAAGPSVVTAAFYNFAPAAVARAVPAVWEHADPATVLTARGAAADAALVRLLGEGAIGSPEMAWAATTAERAARACPVEGRPLFGGHADLPWPERTHLRLWHAVTLLREFRGDGHVASLLSATGDEFDAAFYRRSRGWGEEAWASAEEALVRRGWLADGALTETGVAGRESIEVATDLLSMAPWFAIGEDDADRLRQTVRPWSRAIVAAGGLGF